MQDLTVGSSGFSRLAPLLLPQDSQEPSVYCCRTARLQRAIGTDIRVPGPPVLWLTPLAQLWGDCNRAPGPAPPHAPLWWAGSEWREFPEMMGSPHAQAHAAYTPRRFQLDRHNGGLIRPLDISHLEEGPEETGTWRPTTAALMQQTPGRAELHFLSPPSTLPAAPPPPANGVVRVLRVLLCQRDGVLWSKPMQNGSWRSCPYRFSFNLANTEAFEVRGGDQYVFFFRSRGFSAGGLDTLLLYNTLRNEWLPLAGPTRVAADCHPGDAPVKWRPVDPEVCRFPRHVPRRGPQPQSLLRAWLLESTPDYAVVLAPVSRDGLQRSTSPELAQDYQVEEALKASAPHSALHFIGRNGEVVSHHMACNAWHMSMQRYENHMLFVKDFGQHPEETDESCLDDDWHPSYPRVAAWLLSATDVATPPLPVHLPTADQGWSGSAYCSWSLVLSRGNVEELAPSRQLRLDTSPRLYLLEAGASLRIWASRRVDDDFATIHQRNTFDGTQLLRQSLSFEPIQHSALEVGGEGAYGAWAIWSPDMHHATRVGKSGKLAFWRCAVTYDGEKADLRSLNTCAYASASLVVPDISTVEVFPLQDGWKRYGMSSEDAQGGSVTSGLPCFPALRWAEGTWNRPDDLWIHPISRDAAQHAPALLLR